VQQGELIFRGKAMKCMDTTCDETPSCNMTVSSDATASFISPGSFSKTDGLCMNIDTEQDGTLNLGTMSIEDGHDCLHVGGTVNNRGVFKASCIWQGQGAAHVWTNHESGVMTFGEWKLAKHEWFRTEISLPMHKSIELHYPVRNAGDFVVSSESTVIVWNGGLGSGRFSVLDDAVLTFDQAYRFTSSATFDGGYGDTSFLYREKGCGTRDTRSTCGQIEFIVPDAANSGEIGLAGTCSGGRMCIACCVLLPMYIF
jgi:hypothetical protein